MVRLLCIALFVLALPDPVPHITVDRIGNNVAITIVNSTEFRFDRVVIVRQHNIYDGQQFIIADKTLDKKLTATDVFAAGTEYYFNFYKNGVFIRGDGPFTPVYRTFIPMVVNGP